jgi:adenosylcobinamide-GDP ribazoletransferase
MPIPVLSDVPVALRFLSRLPVPALPFEHDAAPAGMDRLAPAFPLAGVVIALVGVVTFLVSRALFGDLLASVLTVAALVLATGGFHDDGLADTADALGGWSVERRLEIMKDSRIGSFGVLALIVSFALRVGALQTLAESGGAAVAGALVAAGALSRLAGPAMLAALPPARASGLSHGVGRPSAGAMRQAAAIAIVIALVAVFPSLGAFALMSGLVLGLVCFYGLVRLAKVQFGGQTGDVAGAAIQAVEIAFLLGLLIFARHP